MALTGVASLLLLSATGESVGQPHLEVSGYVVHFLMVDRLRPEVAAWWSADRQQAINLTRLRLRPTLGLWANARLRMEYEADAFRFSIPLPFFADLERKPRQLVDLSWRPVVKTHWQLLHFVDRLYIRQDFDFGNVVVGRQRISWGTGRVWNPTDFFNPINPAAFYKLEKDGADAVLIKWYLGDFSDLQLVYNPENRWHCRNVAARLRWNWRSTDFALVVGEVAEWRAVGGDFATSVGGAGVRGEWVYKRRVACAGEAHWMAVFGTDYQFTPKLYGLFEYHFNGRGTLDEQKYAALFPLLLRGEVLNLARHYLFMQATYQIHPLVVISTAQNANLDDHSGFWLTTATVSTSDNSSVSLGAQYFYGRRWTEYWYFPSTFYLQLEWYF